MQNEDLKHLWQALLPSWLSGFVVALASVVIVVGTIFATQLHSSTFGLELFNARQAGAQASSFDFKSITDNLAQNQVISNLPLFLFWAGIGVVVYFFAINIAGAFGSAVEMEREMAYVHAPRQRLIRNAALLTVARLLTLGIWLIYLQVFLRLLLPYALGAAHVATASGLLVGTLYAVLAAAVLIISLHLHVVMLRLIFLRTRLLGSTAEEA